MIDLGTYHRPKGQHHARGLQVLQRGRRVLQDGEVPYRVGRALGQGQGRPQERHRRRVLQLLTAGPTFQVPLGFNFTPSPPQEPRGYLFHRLMKEVTP